LPHSGKIVPTLTKAYANAGAQACARTTQKLFPSPSHRKKKVVACRKHFIISKPAHAPPQKTRIVRFQTARQIHENIRNSASSLYWWPVQDP